MAFSLSDLIGKQVLIGDLMVYVIGVASGRLILDSMTFSKYLNRLLTTVLFTEEYDTFCFVEDPVYTTKDFEYTIDMYLCEGTPLSVHMKFDYVIEIQSGVKPLPEYTFDTEDERDEYFSEDPSRIPPSEKIQVYDSQFEYIGAATNYSGEIDCSENPNPSASEGDFYVVTVGGNIGLHPMVPVSANNMALYTDGEWTVIPTVEAYVTRTSVWDEIDVEYEPFPGTCTISIKMNTVLDENTITNKIEGNFDAPSGTPEMFSELISIVINVHVEDPELMRTFLKVKVDITDIEYTNCIGEELKNMSGCVPKTFENYIVSKVPP